MKLAMRVPFTPPMECLSAERLPEREGWVYELKLDGFRAQAIRDSGGVELYSKNGKDFTGSSRGLLLLFGHLRFRTGDAIRNPERSF
jgi:ATP-dependent DNA ligase